MTALEVRAIAKRFGTRTVLDAVDLDVAGGETVVLLGPNGSGKSTLLGCVCGTVIPDAGSVRIAGHDLAEQPLEARAALRYLPQEPETPDGLTGRELLQFFADVHGDSGGAQEAARFTELGEALERLATTYSVGMRRNLMFGALVVGQAALFVLDEPFAGVDRDGRVRMVDALKARIEAGAGILIAAHDRDAPELETLSARRVDLGGAP